jgi:hypothetical protein
MIAGAQGAPRASEMGRGIGGLVTGIAAGLMEAAVRKERSAATAPLRPAGMAQQL